MRSGCRANDYKIREVLVNNICFYVKVYKKQTIQKQAKEFPKYILVVNIFINIYQVLGGSYFGVFTYCHQTHNK